MRLLTETSRTRHHDIGDGAVVERLSRMRVACHALAVELASARRELRAVEAELRRVKQRHGEKTG
jgi:hypothetical protein